MKQPWPFIQFVARRWRFKDSEESVSFPCHPVSSGRLPWPLPSPHSDLPFCAERAKEEDVLTNQGTSATSREEYFRACPPAVGSGRRISIQAHPSKGMVGVARNKFINNALT